MGRLRSGLALVAAVLLGIGAPGHHAGAAVAFAPTSAPSAPVLEGTVLRFGDQFGLIQGVMGFSGEGEDLPYEVEYVTTTPGPVQLQGFQAGEYDAGALSALALIQAGAGELGLRAVARWQTDFALTALVTSPDVDGVGGWADLPGRRVAFQRATTAEAVAMLALDRLGFSLDDIEVVDVPLIQLGAVLQHGDADVAVMSEPFASAYLDDNPTASYVLGVEDPVGQSSLIVARAETLDDPALSAALGDFVTRLDSGFRALTSDKERFAQLAVDVWGLDRAYVDRILAGSSGVAMSPVPGDLDEGMGRLLELLAVRGDVPDGLGVAELFDGRYNASLGG